MSACKKVYPAALSVNTAMGIRSRSISQPNQIKLYFCIATLARPQVKRSGSYFIYKRHGKAESRQIYPFDIMLAIVACFDPDVVVLRNMKIADLRGALFSTINARHSPEMPHR